MPEKDPENINWFLQAVPLAFSAFLAAIGGAVRYFNHMEKHGAAFNVFTFLVEVCTSGFVGIASFVLCDAAGFGWQMTAFVVAISGHMGARALFLAERAIFLPLLRRYGYGYTDCKTKAQGTEKADQDA